MQLMSDKICLVADSNACTKDDFQVWGLYRKVRWPPSSLDGALSLWAGRKTGSSALFVPQLHSQNVLSQSSFSIFYGSTKESSFIDFGTPNAAIVGDYSKVTWVPTTANNDKWTSSISGFRWGTGETDPDQKTYTT